MADDKIIKLNFELSKQDGTVMATQDSAWYNLSLEEVVFIEGVLLDAIKSLGEKGLEDSKAVKHQPV